MSSVQRDDAPVERIGKVISCKTNGRLLKECDQAIARGEVSRWPVSRDKESRGEHLIRTRVFRARSVSQRLAADLETLAWSTCGGSHEGVLGFDSGFERSPRKLLGRHSTAAHLTRMQRVLSRIRSRMSTRIYTVYTRYIYILHRRVRERSRDPAIARARRGVRFSVHVVIDRLEFLLGEVRNLLGI